MKPTVVILLSDKRSGSTIFQKEICSHPQIQTVDYSTHRYLETQHWLKAASLLDMPTQTYYDRKVYGAFKSKNNTRAQTIDTIVKNIPEFDIPASDRELVFKGWEALCHKFAQPVFFEKSPQHLAQWASVSLLLEWIEQTDFDVKIIGLVRNPLSVQYSAYELFRTESEVRQYGWADMYRNLLAIEKMIPSENFLCVKYEDLIAGSNEFFKQVFEFVGVSPHELTESTVHTASKQRWIEDPLFTVKLHESVKQVARHFGYTDDEMFNPDKPGRTRMQKAFKFVGDTYKSTRHRIVERMIKPLILRWRQRQN